MKAPKLGRPKLPKGEAKSKMLKARVSPSEFEAVERAAKKAGETVSEWARSVILRESQA